MPASRWLRAAFALLICVSALGCIRAEDSTSSNGDQSGSEATQQPADDGDPGAPAQPGEPGDGDVPGAPGRPPGEGEALGAPIRIPPITDATGLSLDQARARLENLLRGVCPDGDVCVTVRTRVVPPDASAESCNPVATDPPENSEVRSGKETVVVLVCHVDPSEPEPSDEGTVPPDDGTEPEPEDEPDPSEGEPEPPGDDAPEPEITP
jgi:hypothetical protein